MRNMPVFTTQSGVASLILDQIPYTKAAFIHIQNSVSPIELLEECVMFCRVVGAETVYATGDSSLKRYPIYTRILGMEVAVDLLQNTDAVARPVAEDERERWRQIYNERMRNVDNAAYISRWNMNSYFDKNDAYFVYEGDQLIGLGKASGSFISVVASVMPGCGRETVLALAMKLTSDVAKLEVAATNHRAIKLYERLGFAQTEVIKTWYKII